MVFYLTPCLALVLNMQSSLFATEALVMSSNINCTHPPAIIERSDHHLVHNDVRDNQHADPFNPDLADPITFFALPFDETC